MYEVILYGALKMPSVKSERRKCVSSEPIFMTMDLTRCSKHSFWPIVRKWKRFIFWACWYLSFFLFSCLSGANGVETGRLISSWCRWIWRFFVQVYSRRWYPRCALRSTCLNLFCIPYSILFNCCVYYRSLEITFFRTGKNRFHDGGKRFTVREWNLLIMWGNLVNPSSCSLLIESYILM